MTLYFYDLETSSGSPRGGRIMQFAGQRTTLDLKPIGKPNNFLVKLHGDVLPDPYAILVHGITPQQSLADGITEAELIDYFEKEIVKNDTIFVGFNSVRFDDEFMRRALYRCLRDPYTWQWQNGRSRWDLMDPLRMMRALRPEGLKWPFAPDGKATVRLESMAKINNIEHKAHDALGDITALIEIARMFKKAQPKLFGYLLSIRDKKSVAKLVENKKPFLYTSGKYSSEFEKTTVALMLAKHAKREAAVVYDLRHDPTPYLKLSPTELARRWKEYDPELRLPLKTLAYNRCPAVAPMSVLDDDSQKRLQIDLNITEANQKTLAANPKFIKTIEQALELMDQEQSALFDTGSKDVDDAIYDGFWSDQNRKTLADLLSLEPKMLLAAAKNQPNSKIAELSFRYVARNFNKQLNTDQKEQWENQVQKRLFDGGDKSQVSRFFAQLAEAAKQPGLTKNDNYLLTELQLYAESILPEL